MMSYGVSYEEYWEGNYRKFPNIVAAHYLKVKRDIDIKRQLNENLAHNIGGYVQIAIASNFNKSVSYPKQSVQLNISREDKALAEEQKRQAAKLIAAHKNLFE